MDLKITQLEISSTLRLNLWLTMWLMYMIINTQGCVYHIIEAKFRHIPCKWRLLILVPLIESMSENQEDLETTHHCSSIGSTLLWLMNLNAHRLDSWDHMISVKFLHLVFIFIRLTTGMVTPRALNDLEWFRQRLWTGWAGPNDLGLVTFDFSNSHFM